MEENIINKTKMLKDLRENTLAGMADCKAALEESAYDYEAAVSLVKARGLSNTSRNAGKVASEGRIAIFHDGNHSGTCIEVNSQTDFTAGSPAFIAFADKAGSLFRYVNLESFSGDLSKIFTSNISSLEDERKELMSTTKENIVISRWAREEVSGDNRRVFSYLHSNNKLGVLLSMEGPDKEAMENAEFIKLSEDLAMQIAAMAPIAVSADQVSEEEKAKQKTIFETQLKESGKAEAQWEKILPGKFSKYYRDVCLLEQESVLVPKKAVKEVIEELSKKLSGKSDAVKILSFIRMVVGETAPKAKEEDYAAEISKMTGVPQDLSYGMRIPADVIDGPKDGGGLSARDVESYSKEPIGISKESN